MIKVSTIIFVLILAIVSSTYADQAPPKPQTHFRFKDDDSKREPFEFLAFLIRQHDRGGVVVTVDNAPGTWIKKEHIGLLVLLMDSKEPCASVYAARSSAFPPKERFKPSTVGHEAAYLINSYRNGLYPSSNLETSTDLKFDLDEIKRWWAKYQEHAAAAAGAGIELNGKHVGGYTLKWDGESSGDLAWRLSKHPITLERDFVIPVDAHDPTSATLKGKIRILSEVRSDRKAVATATVLKLVKREGAWYADAESLERILCFCKEIAKRCTSPGCEAKTDEEHAMFYNHVPRWVRVHEKTCPLATTSKAQ